MMWMRLEWPCNGVCGDVVWACAVVTPEVTIWKLEKHDGS
jgi:hypothetical protein